DVAVDDPLEVGGGETGGDLGGDVDGLEQRQRPALDPALEGLAVAEGHGDEQPLVLRLVDLVDGADVGMVEHRGGPRLAQEAPLVGLVAATVGGEELEGDGAPELEVLGLVHDSRTPAGEAFENPVAGDGAADQRRGPWSA